MSLVESSKYRPRLKSSTTSTVSQVEIQTSKLSTTDREFKTDRKTLEESLIDELLGLYLYEDDWDGDGAVAPPKVLIRVAIKIIRNWAGEQGFVLPDDIGVAPDGSILFVFNNEEEVELQPDLKLFHRCYVNGKFKSTLIFDPLSPR